MECVPWPSMPRFRATRPRPSWVAGILEYSVLQEERLTRSTSQGKRLVFRVKPQIKTVLTNVVVEHVKSRMGNAKTKQR